MPRFPQYVLAWSSEHALYELFTQHQPDQRFTPGEEDRWLAWLASATSFVFQGRSGCLNVYRERRPRGETYWYAYHSTGSRTHKRYLGSSARVTFARLEEMAQALSNEPLSTSRTSELPADESAVVPLLASPVVPPEDLSEMVLLSTRFSPPLLPSWLLAREHLLTRLDAVLSHRLTLLSASAGWGKTTLLSTWAARSTVPIAWLSLDEMDNEPTRFWVLVLNALRTCLPGIGETALAMLRSPQPSRLTVILSILLNELNSLTRPMVLLLDDYHLVEDQDIHDTLLFLLEHLPAQLHLVLASRIDPPLTLSRLRVSGQLLELRDADLRFQEEEATSFFSQAMHLSLPPEDVDLLTRRTEGWIAGLQLAALSMRHMSDLSAFVQSFTGSHRHVLDYVQEEILAYLPASLQNFLPQIAILNRISAPLCQALIGEVESGALLEQAERANLFLVPLDEERRSYRMHDLFRGALLTHLRTAQPELVLLLHQRAARFYEAQGEFREAIFHALAAEDFWSAARLMEQTAETVWLAGESQVLYQWSMALPLAVVRKHARFVLTAALYIINFAASTERARVARAQAQIEQMRGRVEAAMLWEDATQETLEHEPLPTTELALLRQRLLLLRLWSGVIGGIGTGSNLEEYRRTVEQMQQLDRDEDILWQMIPLSTTFVLRWSYLGEGASLIPIYEDAREQAWRSGNRFAILKVQQWLSAIYLRAGMLRLAARECRVALDLISQIRGHTLLGGYVSLWLASVAYERNQLDEARSLLRKLISDAQTGQQLDIQVNGYFDLFELELAADNLAAAHQILQLLTTLLQETAWYPWLLSWVQVLYWLKAGDLAQAARWAAHADIQPNLLIHASRHKLLMLVQVPLALQQYRSALENLERFRACFDPSEVFSNMLAFLALSVVARHQAGEREEAQTILGRLLGLTEPEDYVRIYLDMGLPMQEALQDFLQTPPVAEGYSLVALRSHASRLLAAFAQETQQRSRSHEQSAPAQDTAQREFAAPALLEPLTSQEQRVLRLLVAGRTNPEIAQLLVISLNTVKTHVQNLYRKLNVSNRVQVSALARALHLL